MTKAKVEPASSHPSLLARSRAWLIARSWKQLFVIFIVTLALAAFNTIIIDWLPFIDEAFLYAAVIFIGRAIFAKATS